jgi:photosystem II stability/assembly factor-like uncharacterized protein
MVRIYAGTYDGLQMLNEQGETSGQVFPGRIVQALTGCREMTERIFAGLNDGLYRSDDAGKNWRKVLAGDIRSVTVDPTDDSVVYAGTDPVHLHRSEDGGDSWQELTSLQRLPEETHEKLGEAEQPDMATSHLQTFRHRRQDWWFPVPPHQGHVLHMFIHPGDPNQLLLSIEHGGVALSRDRGATWEDVSEGIDYLDIHVVAAMPPTFDRYLVTSARGLYATEDPAQGWTRAQNGIDRDYFHDLVVLPPANGGQPELVVASAYGSPGFWPAIKGRGEWDKGQTGSQAALFKSADGGRSWRRAGAGQGLPDGMSAMIWALCPHPTEKRSLFAGLGESSAVPSPAQRGGGAVLLSEDGGESWRTIRDGMSAVEHIHVAAA